MVRASGRCELQTVSHLQPAQAPCSLLTANYPALQARTDNLSDGMLKTIDRRLMNHGKCALK